MFFMLRGGKLWKIIFLYNTIKTYLSFIFYFISRQTKTIYHLLIISKKQVTFNTLKPERVISLTILWEITISIRCNSYFDWLKICMQNTQKSLQTKNILFSAKHKI